MKKPSSRSISFLQAAGIVAYILFFAFIVQYLGHRYDTLPVSPFLSMALFLITFVFSAVVCSAIFLGYPTYLFFDGKKKEAIWLVLQSISWLAVFLIVFLVLLLFTASLK